MSAARPGDRALTRDDLVAAASPGGAEQVVALLTAILAELQQLRMALTYEDDECGHPPDQRLNLGAMGSEEWQCKVCGFHYRRPLRGEAGP